MPVVGGWWEKEGLVTLQLATFQFSIYRALSRPICRRLSLFELRVLHDFRTITKVGVSCGWFYVKPLFLFLPSWPLRRRPKFKGAMGVSSTSNQQALLHKFSLQPKGSNVQKCQHLTLSRRSVSMSKNDWLVHSGTSPSVIPLPSSFLTDIQNICKVWIWRG